MKEPTVSRRILVVGLGNPLSGDDGFGAHVLELLHQNGTGLLPGVSLADAHTDLLNHIEDFAQYDCVVLIDAILDPEGKLGRWGRVLAFKEEVFLSWADISQDIHKLSPLLAVKLFRLLHPGAQTQIALAGLLVDHIDQAPCYLTAESVAEGAAAVQSLLGNFS